MEEKPTICPFCQSPLQFIPSGVSNRTGKPYKEFWACSNRDCNYVYNTPQKGNPQTVGLKKEGDQGEIIIHGLSLIRGDIKQLSDKIDLMFPSERKEIPKGEPPIKESPSNW